jgi:hypothetical protein
MTRWITRKNSSGAVVQGPVPCYDLTTIAAIPGMRTAAECVHLLLNDGEEIEGGLEQPVIKIVRGGYVVGYFELASDEDQHGDLTPPGGGE